MLQFVFVQEGSDLVDRLQQDRLVVTKRRGLDDRAVFRLIRGRSRLKDDGSTVVAADAPQSPATSDEDANRKLVRRPAKLDVPVGEAKPQDRLLRCGVVAGHKDFSVLLYLRTERRAAYGCSARDVLRAFVSKLDVHHNGLAIRRRRDSPQLALTPDPVADSWRRVLARIDLEVAVRVADLESSSGHRAPRCVGDHWVPWLWERETPATNRVRAVSDEPLAHSPLVPAAPGRFATRLRVSTRLPRALCRTRRAGQPR
jgi:hypothetical protein